MVLRFAALILLAGTTTAAADSNGCDAVRFGATTPAIGLRRDKVISLTTSSGNVATDFAIIAPPPGDARIAKIMVAESLAGTLALACAQGPDPAAAQTCDMTIPGTALELVVTFASGDAAAAESRAQAVARYVADSVLCPLN